MNSQGEERLLTGGIPSAFRKVREGWGFERFETRALLPSKALLTPTGPPPLIKTKLFPPPREVVRALCPTDIVEGSRPTEVERCFCRQMSRCQVTSSLEAGGGTKSYSKQLVFIQDRIKIRTTFLKNRNLNPSGPRKVPQGGWEVVRGSVRTDFSALKLSVGGFPTEVLMRFS